MAESDIATTDGDKSPKRRWLRISLRSSLVLFVVVCLPLALLMNDVRQRRLAIESLVKVGCSFGDSLSARARTPTILER